MVAITPLGLLPISSLFAKTENLWRRFWYSLASVLGLGGLGVQIIAVLIDDREYKDITASIVDLAKGWDFVHHGVIDSLTLSLSPAGQFLQVNTFGIVMLSTAALLLGCILKSILQQQDVSKVSLGWSTVLLVLVLLVQLVSLITWIVGPNPQVLVTKANTRFVAGNLFLADNRDCEASAMYLQALGGKTVYQKDAFARIGELLPRSRGLPITPNESVANVQTSEGAIIEEDDTDSLSGASSLKISLPLGKDADVSVYTNPIGARPNQMYEFSGWIKGEGINGEKYAVVSIIEDDGNWGNGRGTDARSMSGSIGWQPFAQTITTLPTTRRFFLRAGLWRTHGTVWLDLLQFADITEGNPATQTLRPCSP